MNRLRVAAFLAIAAVGSACLDLTGLPPLSTDSARDVLREFCGCDRLAIINLTDTCKAIVEAMPDDSDTVALAAGVCSDCFGNFEACWSTLTAPAERELCSGDGALGAAGDACAINDNCASRTCVGGACAGCEAGLPNGSKCYSPRECASGACELDLEALQPPGSSLSGICSDACSGCIGANQAPDSGVCLDAAIAAREVAECLCAPMGFPLICRGTPDTKPCGDLSATGAELLKDCVARLFAETDGTCSNCLLGARADQCDSEIMACDGSLAQPQPQDGG
jgi:hypothetical protein